MGFDLSKFELYYVIDFFDYWNVKQSCDYLVDANQLRQMIHFRLIRFSISHNLNFLRSNFILACLA